MEREPSPQIDDELFNEVYGKEYSGPLRSGASGFTLKQVPDKRPSSDTQSDEEEPRDPNAVPTDFTSREAKVWEAKAKATERNWKKRKEEEMICKICGESGHFTQGCPSTLGANRKSADFFERVPARDKDVRALFSEKVISQIERDVGCKIKMEEKFLIVSGKDRLVLSKGVDAVHKMVQDNKDKKTTSNSSNRKHSRSPDSSPRSSYPRRSESQISHSSPGNTSHFLNRVFNHGMVQNHIHQERHKFPRDSPQAYANDGGKIRSAHSRSPARTHFGCGSYRSYNRHSLNTGIVKSDSWNENERRGVTLDYDGKSNFSNCPQTLEELEMVFKSEAMELRRLRDQEEDEENYKHREFIRDLRENYMKKLMDIRGLHKKQSEEYLQHNMQRRQQVLQAAHDLPAWYDYDQSSGNMQYAGSGFSVDTIARYQFPGENYSATRPEDAYGEFQHSRSEDLGRTYRLC